MLENFFYISSSETLPSWVGSMIILVSLCKVLIDFIPRDVWFRRFDLFVVPVSLSIWAFCIFQPISSTRTIIAKYGPCLIFVAKLRLLFSTDFSESLNCRLLALITALTEAWCALLQLQLCSFIHASLCMWGVLTLWNSWLYDLSRFCWILYLSDSSVSFAN